MTRGRKPNPEPEIIDAPMDEACIDNAMAVMQQTASDRQLAQSQHDAAVRAVAAQIGYQLPADCADPDLIQRDIAANMRRTIESMIEIGRGLIVLREACEHGEFMARLEVLGFEPRAAQRYMQVVRKFANASTSTHLLKAAGTQTKLLEMLVLDDEQVEELELTGQIGELKLDDIATMSVKELRAALRTTREELEDTRTRSAEKSQQIEELHEKQLRIRRTSPDDVATELAAETAERVGEALIKLDTSVRSAFTALAEHHAAHGGSDFRHLMAGHVAELQRRLNELRDTFHLRDIEGDGTPEWMKWSPDGTGDAPAAGE